MRPCTAWLCLSDVISYIHLVTSVSIQRSALELALLPPATGPLYNMLFLFHPTNNIHLLDL
jgi:hypothetical protein